MPVEGHLFPPQATKQLVHYYSRLDLNCVTLLLPCPDFLMWDSVWAEIMLDLVATYATHDFRFIAEIRSTVHWYTCCVFGDGFSSHCSCVHCTLLSFASFTVSRIIETPVHDVRSAWVISSSAISFADRCYTHCLFKMGTPVTTARHLARYFWNQITHG